MAIKDGLAFCLKQATQLEHEAQSLGLAADAGGIDKKVRLLQMEGAMTHDLFIPTRGTAL